MAQTHPFTATGKTQLVAANATAQQVQFPAGYGVAKTLGNCTQALVVNLSTSLLWVLISDSGTAAVIPTGSGASAQNGIPILPNTAQTLSVPGSSDPLGAFFSVIAPAAGPFNITVTPGEGM